MTLTDYMQIRDVTACLRLLTPELWGTARSRQKDSYNSKRFTAAKPATGPEAT